MSKYLYPSAVFAATLALYVSTLAPGMLRGDSGEFQWAMASLNVAHATGYPLLTLIGHAWLQLPIPAAPAWRLNLLSALFGAGAVAMVFILARAITRRTGAALAAALFLAAAPVFWFNASILEVYSLNAFFLALILYLFWRWVGEASRPTGDTPLYAAFFVLGLSLAHHRLTVLLVPGILVFALLVDRGFFRNWKRLLVLALLLLPGLALYLYVPLRLVPAGATLQYAFFDIILGQEFSSSLRLYPDPLYVLARVPIQNFHLGLALAAVGAVSFFRRARNFSALLIIVLVSDVLFALFYTVPDVEVFLTPSFVILALWIAAGTAWLIEWAAARLGRERERRAALLVALPVLVIGLFSLPHYGSVRAQVAAEAGGKEERARAILGAKLPAGALLELDWETATALRFIQTVENARPDLEARLIKVNQREEYFWMLKNVDNGRPLYVERGVKWTRAAAGYRVESAPVDLALVRREPSHAAVVKGTVSNRLELVGVQNDSQALGLNWQVSKPLQRDLATFVHMFDAEGSPLGQEDHGACCEAIYGYRTSEWEPGQVMAETFRPVPPETTYLQTGLYSLNGDELETYGQTIYLQTQAIEVDASARPLGAQLGPVAVAAYTLARNGGGWQVGVYWRATTNPGQDFKIFVHLLDGAGKIVGQADHDPVGGVYPTGAWRPGQTVRDRFAIAADPAGVKLEFGLYDPVSGNRVRRADGGDTITIDLP